MKQYPRTLTVEIMGMPNRTLTLQQDTAKVLMEALAQALGAHVMPDWTQPDPDVEINNVAVTTH